MHAIFHYEGPPLQSYFVAVMSSCPRPILRLLRPPGIRRVVTRCSASGTGVAGTGPVAGVRANQIEAGRALGWSPQAVIQWARAVPPHISRPRRPHTQCTKAPTTAPTTTSEGERDMNIRMNACCAITKTSVSLLRYITDSLHGNYRIQLPFSVIFHSIT